MFVYVCRRTWKPPRPKCSVVEEFVPSVSYSIPAISNIQLFQCPCRQAKISAPPPTGSDQLRLFAASRTSPDGVKPDVPLHQKEQGGSKISQGPPMPSVYLVLLQSVTVCFDPCNCAACALFEM